MAVKTKNSKTPRKPKNCGHTPEQHKKIRADRNKENLQRHENNIVNKEKGFATPWEFSKEMRSHRRAHDPNVQARKKVHNARAAAKRALSKSEAA